MDATQALKDAENTLRDFIAYCLHKQFGENWEAECGVSPERLEKWRERKSVEAKRQEAGVVEERLLYYADFYDLKAILKKHWAGIFSQSLGDWKTMEVWLNELEKLRDPDAHRRELLPHQHYLAVGISGEIRTRIIRFRSEQETADSYFPRIESVRDGLGTIWTVGKAAMLWTGRNVNVGDTIDFVITATDPLGAPLQYSVSADGDFSWQEENAGSLTFNKTHIGKDRRVFIAIRSPREYHAELNNDDMVVFCYAVLPPQEMIG